MALSNDEADELLRNNEWCKWSDARELLVEASALGAAKQRKADTELIRQMLDALENHAGNYKLTKTEAAVVNAAITAARARLGDEPTKAQPAIHPATVAACIARLEQGGQSAAVSILRHHFEQKGG